jgi:hypothetical protein
MFAEKMFRSLIKFLWFYLKKKFSFKENIYERILNFKSQITTLAGFGSPISTRMIFHHSGTGMADFNSLAVIHDSLLETYFTVLF